MSLLGNIVIALARVADAVLGILVLAIIIRAVISWFSPDPYNPLVQILNRLTEPILQPIRRFLPPVGIDFSPIIAWLLIEFIRTALVQSLFEIGYNMKY